MRRCLPVTKERRRRRQEGKGGEVAFQEEHSQGRVVTQSSSEIFQREADRYDAWFDSEHGRALFGSEVRCLQQVSAGLPRPWLEVGVGTGRFAEPLEVDIGVDPAIRALRYAARRGVSVLAAVGEALPLKDGRFGAVFVIVTLCFADKPGALLREAARVVSRDGAIVLGIVPAESPWGRFYAAKARAGHVFYSAARFFTLPDLRHLAEAAGLRAERAVSTLFQRPGGGSYAVEPPREGEHAGAGFVATLCRPRPASQAARAGNGTRREKRGG